MSTTTFAVPASSATVSARRIPSLTDIFFVAVMIWCFLAGAVGYERLFVDGDAGVHIRIGDWILDHGTVPRTDIFSWSKPGGAWCAYEWLAGVIFAGLHRAGGLGAVALFTAAILTLTMTLVLQEALRQGARPLVALPFALMAANALQIHFFARPHIFTQLFLVVFAAVLWRDRERASHALWLLIPLTALWANLHGGFFILGPLLVLWIAAAKDRKRYLLLAAGCAAATLANPYGWGLHAHIIEYLGESWVMEFVGEFKSPQFRTETMAQFMILLFAGLACVGLWLPKRRWLESLWVVFLAYCALKSVRHVTVYVLLTTPLIAAELSRHWEAWVSGQARKSTARILDEAVSGLAAGGLRLTLWTPLLVCAFLVAVPPKAPRDLAPEFFPVKVVARHAETLVGARVFCSDQWADYLIYRNWPRQKVFMDARHNYFGVAIGNDFLALLAGRPGWKTLFDKYGFDAALLPLQSPLTAILETQPEWKRVDADGVGVLFLKR